MEIWLGDGGKPGVAMEGGPLMHALEQLVDELLNFPEPAPKPQDQKQHGDIEIELG